MFGIGTGELILIVVIALLVIGPERTADYARRAGELITKLRTETDQVTREFKEAFAAESEQVKELQDANPLTALTELRDEATAAARDFQNVLAGKPTSAAKATPKTAAPEADATKAQGPAPQAQADDAEAASGAPTVTEPGKELFEGEGYELDGPLLIEAESEQEPEKKPESEAQS